METSMMPTANAPTGRQRQERIFWLLGGLFVALNGLAVAFEQFYFLLLPYALVVVYLALFAMDKLLLLVVFLVPLSVPLSELSPGFGFDMFLPTEPLLFGLMLIFLMKLLLRGWPDRAFARHPVSVAVYLHLAWMLLAALASEMPVVSLKYLLVRVWFLVAFYFFSSRLFAQDPRKVERFVWLYALPLLLVIGYSVSRLYGQGFLNQQAAHWVMNPFYKDHTSYGAILAMLLPFLVGMAFYSRLGLNVRVFVMLLVGIYLFALVLSYTRAAWLSLVGALGVMALVLLRARPRTLLAGALVAAGLLWSFQDTLVQKLESNRVDSSTNLEDHVRSMSNIATDASNLERINRWKSALRMFAERPVLGWGPGTYMFLYAPYQYSYEKTIISTNAGDKGNAHSEYLGALAEQGVPGTLSYLAIVLLTVAAGARAFHNERERHLKMVIMSLLLGLVTYYLHGFLNNFLDTDKISAPFWGFTAALVVLDLRARAALASVPEAQAPKKAD